MRILWTATRGIGLTPSARSRLPIQMPSGPKLWETERDEFFERVRSETLLLNGEGRDQRRGVLHE